MTERNGLVNPNICINSIVVEVTNGRGYCNPEYRRKFRDETTECKGCPKPGAVGTQSMRVSRKSFMSPEEIKEAEIASQLYRERIRRAAKITGKFLRI